jgi:hypothetical protein
MLLITTGKEELVALAEEMIRLGNSVMRVPIMYFAFGSQWELPSACRLRDATGLATLDLDEETIEAIFGALAGPSVTGVDARSFPNGKWEMMLTYRKRYGEEQSDLCLMRQFFIRSHDNDDPLINRLLDFWRSQLPDQRTRPVRKLISALEEGVECREAWLAALPEDSE